MEYDWKICTEALRKLLRELNFLRLCLMHRTCHFEVYLKKKSRFERFFLHFVEPHSHKTNK